MNEINELKEVLSKNAFGVFRIQPSFIIDLAALTAMHHRLQKLYHPDNWINSDVASLIVSVSAHVNTSYTKLKNPLERAMLLLELSGYRLDLAQDTNLPEKFLFEQMEFHEQVDEASNNIDKLESLEQELIDKQKLLINQLSDKFESKQFEQATELTKQLAFYQRLLNLVANTISIVL